MKLDLKSLYKQKIVPSLIEEFGYKNIEQVPKLVKISVNRGVGEASKNSKELDSRMEELSLIVGQQPTINKATRSVAGFKIRDGMSIGASVTLRKEQMYTFSSRDIPRLAPHSHNVLLHLVPRTIYSLAHQMRCEPEQKPYFSFPA